jgi:hypothetical protein
MVFAVIGPEYKSQFLLADGTVDTDKYIENLDELHFIKDLDERQPLLQWIFRQDGAAYHTSEKPLEWLEGNWSIIADWQANFPDLSPIELLWAMLKRIVQNRDRKTPRTWTKR